MERRQVRTTLSRILVIVVGLSVGLASEAGAEGHHRRCSDATLDGSYAYYRTGTILPDGGALSESASGHSTGRAVRVGPRATTATGSSTWIRWAPVDTR